jgi:hypothetical protein
MRDGRGARLSRRLALSALLLAISAGCSGSSGRGAAPSSAGPARAVVALVGDSNVVRARPAIADALVNRPSPYKIVDLASVGTSIRTEDCRRFTPCTTFNFWQSRIAQARAGARPDAFVVDLGVNDAAVTSNSVQRVYRENIDWLMRLIGPAPVVWTNVPCKLEPPSLVDPGLCRSMNAALRAAPARWPNLAVLDWAAIAEPRRDFMQIGTNHYSETGQIEWARFVARELDRKFPEPG